MESIELSVSAAIIARMITNINNAVAAIAIRKTASPAFPVGDSVRLSLATKFCRSTIAANLLSKSKIDQTATLAAAAFLQQSYS
jgi:hypothetical protein